MPLDKVRRWWILEARERTGADAGGRQRREAPPSSKPFAGFHRPSSEFVIVRSCPPHECLTANDSQVGAQSDERLLGVSESQAGAARGFLDRLRSSLARVLSYGWVRGW